MSSSDDVICIVIHTFLHEYGSTSNNNMKNLKFWKSVRSLNICVFVDKTYATYTNNQGFKKVDNHSFCKILIL